MSPHTLRKVTELENKAKAAAEKKQQAILAAEDAKRRALEVANTPEEIEIRCDAVDRVNAETVEKSRQFASEEVKSGAA